jgi:ATP-dependent protease ClpP protease subunit
MTTPYYTITARGPTAADIRIDGPIGDSLWQETVTARAFIAELGSLKGRELTLYINSPGGSVMDATAIYNALQRHDRPVNIIVDGWALSAASLIAMAGQTLTMGSGSLLMLHNPSTAVFGNAADHRKVADVLETVGAGMRDAYIAKTGAAEATVAGWLDAETWFTADEAIAAKLADAKTERTQPFSPAPPTAHFKNLPTAIAATPKPPKENPMPQEFISKDSIVAADIAVMQAASEAAADAAVVKERARVSEITAIIPQLLRIQPSERESLTALANTLIASGASIEAARKQFLEALGNASPGPLAAGQGCNPTGVSGGMRPMVMGPDETDKFRAAAADALLIRAGLLKNDPTNGLRGMRLSRMAETCAMRAGLDVGTFGQNEMAMVKAAITHSTSDFPVILENVLNKTLLDTYAVAADTWNQWCAIGSVADFRPYKRLRLGSFGNLETLNEAGEYKHKAIPDATAETVSIGTKANTITLTRQAIINDDLGAFVRLGQMLARAAARSIEADAYALLASNPTLDSDSTALFHANHGNYHTSGSAAAITMTSLDAARTAIKLQKDRSGNDYIGIQEPFILLCPVAKAGAARTANESEFDPDTANKLQRTNITRGIFSAIVDTPYLSGTGWYLLANPAQFPTFEVLFLNGQQTPFSDRIEQQNVDGVTWLIRHDYGVNVVDYVGAYHNTGA